jgi:hypothetical protein
MQTPSEINRTPIDSNSKLVPAQKLSPALENRPLQGEVKTQFGNPSTERKLISNPTIPTNTSRVFKDSQFNPDSKSNFGTVQGSPGKTERTYFNGSNAQTGLNKSKVSDNSQFTPSRTVTPVRYGLLDSFEDIESLKGSNYYD